MDISVIGGGHQGLTMAAHLSLNGCRVFLWNRTKAHIKKVIETKKIHCSGMIEAYANIYKATSDIKEALTDILMIAAPSIAYEDIAKLLTPFVNKNHIIVLNPGRTFGALFFKKILMDNGCVSLPTILEMQTIIYTCRRDKANSVFLYALKNNVAVAALNSNFDAYDRLPKCFRERLNIKKNYLSVTLDNVGMALHPAPTLMNIGWIETNTCDFKYYYDGITPTIANFIQRMDNERALVAKAAGVHIESTYEWLLRTYNIKGDNLYSAIRNNPYYKDIDAPKTINHRYIEEDVPNGLVPIESMAKAFNTTTPCISLVIDLANAATGKDYRKTGRKYEELIKYL